MGYGEYKSKVKLDYIQDFEMMFERMKIDRPREAATYYTILIIDCPKEFSEFLKTAEELTNITRRPLETGRNSLLRNGLIAEVLFSSHSEEDFGRESYLPVHGNVTLRYSGKWILYNILNNCLDKKNNLRMQIGGERFFDEPFIRYFKKFLA